MRPIRVLLADDSPFLCELLAHYLNEAGGLELACAAGWWGWASAFREVAS